MFLTLLMITALVFIAEVGDKTGLLVIALASKSKNWTAVLLGAITGLGIMTLIGIVFGEIIEKLIPQKAYVQLIAGIIFVIIGVWMLLKKEEQYENQNAKQEIKEDNEEKKSWNKWFLNSLFLIGSAEFLDKTQFVVVALATSHGPLIVFIGALLGFILITLLEIIVGIKLESTFSSKTINLLASIIFEIIGIITIIYSVKTIIS